VDGLASYVTAFLRVFRDPVRTGRRGRPRLMVEPGLLIGQVIKCYARRRVVKVVRRVVRGTATALALALKATRGGTVINTAYIERINATFRSALAPLARRGRAIAHTEAVLTAGMYLVGCAYNFCWYHDSLRLAAPQSAPRKWEERTPAMAAGLTDPPWTLAELLLLKVPLSPWGASKRRGPPPKQKLQPFMPMAAWPRLSVVLPWETFLISRKELVRNLESGMIFDWDHFYVTDTLRACEALVANDRNWRKSAWIYLSIDALVTAP
jgi:uncharacterized membrane protein (Fun14 family)